MDTNKEPKASSPFNIMSAYRDVNGCKPTIDDKKIKENSRIFGSQNTYTKGVSRYDRTWKNITLSGKKSSEPSKNTSKPSKMLADMINTATPSWIRPIPSTYSHNNRVVRSPIVSASLEAKREPTGFGQTISITPKKRN